MAWLVWIAQSARHFEGDYHATSGRCALYGVGQFVGKGLTTVDQPKRELGQAAARAMLNRLNTPNAAAARTILSVSLQARDTSGEVTQ